MDILVRHGGTAILSETPEIYGVEHTLTRRAVQREVGEKLIERIRWWKDEYARRPRHPDQRRASVPATRPAGLANILEKSLGSAMKGGTGPLMEVYRYAEPVTQKGLVFMDTPGFDPVSATGQIAGGANMIVLHHRPRLGLRLRSRRRRSSSRPTRRCTAGWKRTWTSTAARSSTARPTIEEMGEQIFELMLRTASGEKTKSELFGLGDHEFVPWQIGITG